MLTEDEVRHIAKLARISLSAEEVERFTGQLSGVLDYMDILNELDTEDVDGTSQVTGLKNVMRKDEIREVQGSPDELLDCTELPVDSQQIRVLPAIK